MAVNATAVWRVRPSGSNTNGGGYDSGIAGAGTDYSQQNSAQVTGTHGTTTGTTTFVDATANAFTSAMIGNAMYITGTGQTTGWYFVTAFTSSSTVTLDRSPGTGTLATWNLGGGWADFWTNTTSSGPLVPGNVVYILGSGTPNPSSYTYDYVMTSVAPTNGTNAAGYISFANDPATPGYKVPPDTTGGMPTIRYGSGSGTSGFTGCEFNKIIGLWIISNVGFNFIAGGNQFSNLAFGCVYDQVAGTTAGSFTFGAVSVVGCEVFSSGGGTSTTIYAIRPSQDIPISIIGCNIHDCIGGGIDAEGNGVIIGNIVANCKGTGLLLDCSNGKNDVLTVLNNTIDGNGGNGIEINSQSQFGLSSAIIMNNIISNHTGAGKFAMTVDNGTLGANDVIKMLVDYNTFYNNTTNYNAISAGSHDTALSKSPYVNQSTENYTLA